MTALLDKVNTHQRKDHQLTARQVRYLEQETQTFQSQPAAGQRRSYDAIDTALLELVLRLRREGVPSWQIKAILVYMGAELREALARRSNLVLVVVGPRGSLMTPHEAAAHRGPAVVQVPL